MTKEDRDIQRKLKVLRHAEKTGHVARTCRYFGVGRSRFYPAISARIPKAHLQHSQSAFRTDAGLRALT